MKTSIVLARVFLAAGLLTWGGGARADAPRLSDADDKAIRQILKDQATAWNKHDMAAFTKSFRDDVDGINVVGMYWSGKAAILKHLSFYHATNFKDLEETLDEVNVRPIGDGYAMAILIWRVGAFKSPSGAPIPAARHRSSQVLAKGPDGAWQVVHFHNTTIDEGALKAAAAPQK